MLDFILGRKTPVSGISGIVPTEKMPEVEEAGIVGQEKFVPEMRSGTETLMSIATAPGRMLEVAGTAIGKATKTQAIREHQRILDQERRAKAGELGQVEALGEDFTQFGKVALEPLKGLTRTVIDVASGGLELSLKTKKPAAKIFDKILGTNTAGAIQWADDKIDDIQLQYQEKLAPNKSVSFSELGNITGQYIVPYGGAEAATFKILPQTFKVASPLLAHAVAGVSSDLALTGALIPSEKAEDQTVKNYLTNAVIALGAEGMGMVLGSLFRAGVKDLPPVEELINNTRKAIEDIEVKNPGFINPQAIGEDLGLVKKGDPLETEAKKFKTAEEFVEKETIKVYHGSNVEIDEFIPEKGAQGVIWFTDSKKSITDGISGAQGTKYIMERNLTGKNFAGWDEYEKLGLGEIEGRGFDGVKLSQGEYNDYILFDNKGIKTKSQLTEIWNKANKVDIPKTVTLPKGSPVKKGEKILVLEGKFKGQEKEVVGYGSLSHRKTGAKTDGFSVFIKDTDGKHIFIDNWEKPTKGVSPIKPKTKKVAVSKKADINEKTVQVVPKSSKKAKAPKVVEPVGETKTRGLARGIEQKAVEKKLTTSFGELPEYEKISIEEQAKKAAKIIEDDWEKAKRIAMGEEIPTDGVLPESVMVAVEKRALEIGDVDTLRKLATSSNLVDEATTMGQRLRVLAERNPESPVANIQKVAKKRLDSFEKRTRTKATKAKKKVVTDIKKKMKKVSPGKAEWSSFLDSITC